MTKLLVPAGAPVHCSSGDVPAPARVISVGSGEQEGFAVGPHPTMSVHPGEVSANVLPVAPPVPVAPPLLDLPPVPTAPPGLVAPPLLDLPPVLVAPPLLDLPPVLIAPPVG